MTPPLPEPKPVVTLEDGHRILGLNGNPIGTLEVDERGPFAFIEVDLYAAELRAIADWLDQWQDATLLSEVGE